MHGGIATGFRREVRRAARPQSKEQADPMKLLLYAHDWAPTIGGVQIITMELARGLSVWAETHGGPAVEVTVATPTPADGMNDAALPFRVVRRPGLGELVRLIKEADVIHLAGPCLLPMLVGWLLRKPIVVEHHGYQAACPNGLLFYEPLKTLCPGHFMARRYGKCLRCNAGNVGWLKSLAMLLWMFPRRWLTQKVNCNIVISNHVSGRLGLPRTRTIYYGISDLGLARQSQAFSRSAPVCLAYVGRLVAEKGLSLLIDAAKRLDDEGYQFKLRFIGDGPERERLERAGTALGLGHRVVFTGYLEGDALAKTLQDVSVVVMPSIWEETAGLAAIEQMMRGRVVIASDLGGLREVVDGAGLTFAPGEVDGLVACLRQVMSAPDLTAKLGKAARERAQQLFRTERMLSDHVATYQNVVARKEYPQSSDRIHAAKSGK